MRITPSSSFFLATLAISSSSSSLAAPTEQQAVERSGFPSSSNVHSGFMAARGDTFDMRVGGDDDRSSQSMASLHMSTHQERQLESLIPILDGLPVIGGILQPLLEKLMGMLGLQLKAAPGVESVQSITQDDLQALLQLFQQTTQKMTSAVTGAVGGAKSARRVMEMDSVGSASIASSFPTTSGTPFNASASSTMFSSSAAHTATSVEAMAVPTPPVGVPSLPVALPIGGKNNGTLPVSPPLPTNPPNTPIPVAVPKMPLPAGVAPPSGPIPRNAPPMFPGFKAADVSPMSSSSSFVSCESGSPSMDSSDASCTPSATTSTVASATPSSA
ncbi:hypothetical protein BN946_scf185013.g68 [Trametes cinnabarina]|uniref:Uncharacterized protein n=1 Tax=Pycnoporus cinnabarinus TaxID=5643 RepID=A0A060SLZ6_PYCCI|nr:hypothetical protein BN946_scf185013.g68 [Trametes cinnabarina]